LAMQMTARKAVDPIIATLLLIAIAVAAGIIVYVYVNSLAGGLTQSGGQQTTEQLSMDAYSFATSGSNNLIIYIRDSGPSTVTIDSTNLFYDGVPSADTHSGGTGTTCFTGFGASYQITAGNKCYLSFTVTGSAGTSHLVKALTLTGGTFIFPVVSGRSG